jgi:hypothetical protein
MHLKLAILPQAYGPDYESFTMPCFSADMNRVRGLPRCWDALLERDHGTRNR